MNRDDNSRFLLYIEPNRKNKLKYPIEDDITQLMEYAFSRAKKGSANYQAINSKETFNEGGSWTGLYVTDCGEIGGCNDYLLENGLITNDLCVFYVKWYRESIPESDWTKIKSLMDFYGRGK